MVYYVFYVSDNVVLQESSKKLEKIYITFVFDKGLIIWKGDAEKEILCLLIHSPSGCHSQDWSRLTAGTQDSRQVSHGGDTGSGIGAVCY